MRCVDCGLANISTSTDREQREGKESCLALSLECCLRSVTVDGDHLATYCAVVSRIRTHLPLVPVHPRQWEYFSTNWAALISLTPSGTRKAYHSIARRLKRTREDGRQKHGDRDFGVRGNFEPPFSAISTINTQSTTRYKDLRPPRKTFKFFCVPFHASPPPLRVPTWRDSLSFRGDPFRALITKTSDGFYKRPGSESGCHGDDVVICYAGGPDLLRHGYLASFVPVLSLGLHIHPVHDCFSRALRLRSLRLDIVMVCAGYAADLTLCGVYDPHHPRVRLSFAERLLCLLTGRTVTPSVSTVRSDIASWFLGLTHIVLWIIILFSLKQYSPHSMIIKPGTDGMDTTTYIAARFLTSVPFIIISVVFSTATLWGFIHERPRRSHDARPISMWRRMRLLFRDLLAKGFQYYVVLLLAQIPLLVVDGLRVDSSGLLRFLVTQMSYSLTYRHLRVAHVRHPDRELRQLPYRQPLHVLQAGPPRGHAARRMRADGRPPRSHRPRTPILHLSYHTP
ncbi:hypothetical protein NM688_g7281 [Phlebia brevispora]|uniref:Uncharacterized protein n=1 Tax=Phlebia brevispora TaxID=194682 RepID=A0ACC1S6Z0_9APHY|nr:hypothetical protein NM688_g7281 [Phlebia brevispora]